jgi:hypothetical protein
MRITPIPTAKITTAAGWRKRLAAFRAASRTS